MRLCLVGGIFDKSREYRERHRHTPETVLADALESLGIEVTRFGHRIYRPSRDHDVVHVHHYGGAALRAASQTRTPFVFTGHDLRLLNGFPVAAARRHGYRFVTDMADGLVALSHRELALLGTRSAAPQIVRRIPNGIRSDIYRRMDVPHTGQIVALCVAQLDPIKGIDVLLHAVALLRDLPVRVRLVYQTAAFESTYRHLAVELGIDAQVQFEGFLNPDDLVREYSAATMLVLPSRSESLPSVITEALLCGTPVIASDVGAVGEMLGPHGLVVPSGDVTALASAIRRMSERPRLHAAEREVLRSFALREASIADMAQAHVQLYDEVICAGRRRRSAARRILAIGVRTGTDLVEWRRNLAADGRGRPGK
jgi:glycosyltransferase involved in cell wall biosynthesis